MSGDNAKYWGGSLITTTVRQLSNCEMRAVLTLAACLSIQTANAQLLDATVSPLDKGTVLLASEVPAKLGDGATITFDALDIVFDGGSIVARFVRNDGKALTLFFAHTGYWTNDARNDRTQPVALLTRIAGKQALVELKRNSPLEKRIVELLTSDIADSSRNERNKATLMRVLDCVRDRKPLQEIEERMDPKTGEMLPETNSFKTRDPFDETN